MILLDTNIVVAYLNGRANLAQQIADHLPEIAIPSLVAAELYFGACASTRAEENLAKLDRFLQIIPTVNFDLSAARTCGTLKAVISANVAGLPERSMPGLPQWL